MRIQQACQMHFSLTRMGDNIHDHDACRSVPFFFISLCLIPYILNHNLAYNEYQKEIQYRRSNHRLH